MFWLSRILVCFIVVFVVRSSFVYWGVFLFTPVFVFVFVLVKSVWIWFCGSVLGSADLCCFVVLL